MVRHQFEAEPDPDNPGAWRVIDHLEGGAPTGLVFADRRTAQRAADNLDVGRSWNAT